MNPNYTDIFGRLDWLTKRIKSVFSATKTGNLQTYTINAADIETGSGEYIIKEGGIYQFYGGTGTGLTLRFPYPTSPGQIMYILNSSSDTFNIEGLAPADRPLVGSETASAMPNVEPKSIWQLISVDGTPFGFPGLIWRGFVEYI